MAAGSKIRTSASVFVAAPPAVVFELLTDPDAFFDLRPDAVKHRDIEPLPNGGHSCVQVFELRGRQVEQACTTVKFEPPKRIVDRIEAADHSATSTTTLAEDDAGTRLVIEQETALAKRYGPLRVRAIRRDAERRLGDAVERIKEITESRFG